MRVDLNANLEAAAPWKLVLAWDGTDYQTKRPTVGLIGRLEKLKELPPAAAFDLLKQLFTADVDLTTWAPDAVFAALAAYMTYFSNESLKNSGAIAASIAAAMA